MDPAAPGSDRINSVTRVKAVGIDVPSHPVADTFGPTPVELSRLSFHDSSKFRFGPGKLTQAAVAEEHEGSRPDSLRQQVLPPLDVRLTADTYSSESPQLEKAEADAPVALRLVPSAFPFDVRRPSAISMKGLPHAEPDSDLVFLCAPGRIRVSGRRETSCHAPVHPPAPQGSYQAKRHPAAAASTPANLTCGGEGTAGSVAGRTGLAFDQPVDLERQLGLSDAAETVWWLCSAVSGSARILPLPARMPRWQAFRTPSGWGSMLLLLLRSWPTLDAYVFGQPLRRAPEGHPPLIDRNHLGCVHICSELAMK
ncbi:hypothetical protein ACFWA5_40190 [Streptomyces mirabilis]|uniref:hypothetical protein n=1 Tax=Streptomyces mirabilis TaxID=68239 RepID=UPI00364FFC05